jgi:hypothetical protein
MTDLTGVAGDLQHEWRHVAGAPASAAASAGTIGPTGDRRPVIVARSTTYVVMRAATCWVELRRVRARSAMTGVDDSVGDIRTL